MIIFIVAEKSLGFFFYALVNFTTPFGRDWIFSVLLAVPGLIAIDVFFGRLIMYTIAGIRLARTAHANSIFEAFISPLTLVMSFLVIRVVSAYTQELLFGGDKIWNEVGIFQLAVSLMTALGLIGFRELFDASKTGA